jgi:glycosyltransferase involved in cell wall biosynthesis
MRIAIDASRITSARRTGTERYALELTRHLITANAERPQPYSLTLYFRDTPPRDLLPAAPHVSYRIIPFRRGWTHLRFAAALWHDRPDLTFVPAHTLPVLMPGRACVTVHDLGYHLFPQAHPLKQRLYLALTTRYSALRAACVLADSRATRSDLTRIYGIRPEKISVIYPAITPPPIRLVDVRTRYHLPERYFVFIGTLQPRKNIARLVQAYQRFRALSGERVGLVLAGARGWLYDEAWTAGAADITITGFIDEDDKGALLANAEAMVFPSLYEGFGFPVLEAMSCETPVIASSTSSLPELVGDAGLLVDPLDVDDIAQAMARVATDNALRNTLIERGSQQWRRFQWAASARQLLALWETLHPTR